MALWMIDGKQWDDGLKAKPGEPDFSTAKAKAHAKGKPFDYMGTPNWEAPAEPEED